MKTEIIINEEHLEIQESIIQREKRERRATATITSEILEKLNVSIDTLPHKCQQLLQQAASSQVVMDIDLLDPFALSLRQSRELSEKLEEEYEILKLKQKNMELQAKIDRNNKFLQELRNELQQSKCSLLVQSPNPDNIQDYIKQLRQKLDSYEEGCEKTRVKFAKLSVPESVYPKNLSHLISTLASLKEEALGLQQQADDIVFAREARDTFNRLRK